MPRAGQRSRIRPRFRVDGTDLTRLTDAEGNDAHSLWSPDGNFILFSSSRFGYKDESPLVLNQPQPYAELFIMNADGSNQRPLTDNQYEEGTLYFHTNSAEETTEYWPPRAGKSL